MTIKEIAELRATLTRAGCSPEQIGKVISVYWKAEAEAEADAAYKDPRREAEKWVAKALEGLPAMLCEITEPAGVDIAELVRWIKEAAIERILEEWRARCEPRLHMVKRGKP